MGVDHQYRRSDLFLLRMWLDKTVDGTDQGEWHGKLQRVVDGEAYQFNNWSTLIELLEAMIGENPRPTVPSSPADDSPQAHDLDNE